MSALELHRSRTESPRPDPGALHVWRERILATILRVGIPLGLIAYIPSLYLSLVSGLYSVAFIDSVAFFGALLVYRRPAWPYPIRAGVLTALVYILGVWLLVKVGPISQIYLFAFSVLCGLLFNTRAALVSVGINAVTLGVVGYLAHANFDTSFFPGGEGVGAWIVVSINFVLVNAVISVPLSLLVRGLERTLDVQKRASQALENERAELVAANERLNHEIAERADAEARLFRLGMAIEQASDAILLTRPDGAPEYLNAACETMLGLTRQEALERGDNILETQSADGLETFGLAALLKSRVGPDKTITIRTHNEGGTLLVKAGISKLVDSEGAEAGYVIALRDVTAESLLEQRLRQNQKLEAIGTLAGGIAHDFNNILSSILGHAELLTHLIENNPEAAACSNEIVTASTRAKGLIRQILMFSKQLRVKHQPVRIAGLIDEALKLLRPTIPSTIDIVVDIQAPRAAVMADPTELHQVLMNLCTNAFQAMEATVEIGGTLTLSVSEFQMDEALTVSHPRLVSGQHYVRLSVGDTGQGMDADTRERIFDPFFTTKEKGKGTGLGLATVHGIVTALGGEISVYSELGEGTTMCIYLPRDTSTLQEYMAPVSDAAQLIGANRRILVVDDEEALLRLSGRILERQGFVVERCQSSVDALEHVRARPDDFDLVITDLTMPKKTGFQLARSIHDIRPDLPIILMSGFNESLTTADLEAAGVKTFIHKPFTHQEMYAAVHKAMTE